MLSAEEKAALLHLARRAMEAAIASGAAPSAEEAKALAPHDNCQLSLNCFVSVHNHGRLRGCMGGLGADAPLYLAVARSAVNAARSDPRFSPLDLEELAQCEIEISVLSEFRPIKDIGEIVVGRDGLLVENPPQRGLLLPQVASKYNWSAQEFVRQAHIKAGIDPFDPPAGTTISVFEAEVFSEKDSPDPSAV